ncbi:MAG: hypothetical protein EOM64_09810 [Erysipelotrichia bacterium]|nr:hypothetical protein [Erysipelotrichia bacterium]
MRRSHGSPKMEQRLNLERMLTKNRDGHLGLVKPEDTDHQVISLLGIVLAEAMAKADLQERMVHAETAHIVQPEIEVREIAE